MSVRYIYTRLFKSILRSLFLLSLNVPVAMAGDLVVVNLATAGIADLNHFVGKSICMLVNKERQQAGMRCQALNSRGPIFNINSLLNGEMDFAVLESNLQYDIATNKLGKGRLVAAGDNMRAMFSIYDEPFAIVVRQQDNIDDIYDLLGKKIATGSDGAADKDTFAVLLKQLNWRDSDLAAVIEMDAIGKTTALCNGDIDAFTAMVGHPNPHLIEAATACDLKFLSLDEKLISTLLRNYPHYIQAEIPADIYPLNSKPINTVGVMITIVTTNSVSDDIAYKFVRAIFENIDSFKKMHPVLQGLTKESMLKSNSLPFSRGALRYYREQGYIGYIMS